MGRGVSVEKSSDIVRLLSLSGHRTDQQTRVGEMWPGASAKGTVYGPRLRRFPFHPAGVSSHHNEGV